MKLDKRRDKEVIEFFTMPCVSLTSDTYIVKIQLLKMSTVLSIHMPQVLLSGWGLRMYCVSKMMHLLLAGIM